MKLVQQLHCEELTNHNFGAPHRDHKKSLMSHSLQPRLHDDQFAMTNQPRGQNQELAIDYTISLGIL